MAKTINTVERFMEAAQVAKEQYSDGLIHRGEFVQRMRSHLNSIEAFDMLDCKHTVEAYGHNLHDFAGIAENIEE